MFAYPAVEMLKSKDEYAYIPFRWYTLEQHFKGNNNICLSKIFTTTLLVLVLGYRKEHMTKKHSLLL